MQRITRRHLICPGTGTSVYAHPLVRMDVMRQQGPAVPRYTFTAVVNPHVDTRSSLAWLDLEEEPSAIPEVEEMPSRR